MPNLNLDALYTEELTDGAPSVTRIVGTPSVEDVIIDIITNKGLTAVITPILSDTDDSVLGKPSTTLTIAPGGGADRAIYSKISAKKAQVVVTKTESGSTSGFVLKISGIQTYR